MRNNKGFTLIELMIVVAILGVISAVAIPTVISHHRYNQLKLAGWSKEDASDLLSETNVGSKIEAAAVINTMKSLNEMGVSNKEIVTLVKDKGIKKLTSEEVIGIISERIKKEEALKSKQAELSGVPIDIPKEESTDNKPSTPRPKYVFSKDTICVEGKTFKIINHDSGDGKLVPVGITQAVEQSWDGTLKFSTCTDFVMP